MTIPNDTELVSLLDQLETSSADSLENEYLDFKRWEDSKRSRRLAAEMAVCFANSEGGAIVFGVDDSQVGRAAAIHGIGDYDSDAWKRAIFDGTPPGIEVQLSELAVPEGTGKLLVVRVPRGADGPYGTVKGVFQHRIGKECKPLDPRRWIKAQISTGAVDWSGEPAREITRTHLDPLEIERARIIIRARRPRSELKDASDDDLLAALKAVRGGKVTHTGLLLFGRESVLAEVMPQHVVQYSQQPDEMSVAVNEHLRTGLLSILDWIERQFEGASNPEQEVSFGFIKLRIPAYDLGVVREAVLNAVTHRDYSLPNRVTIRQTPRELVCSSPGGFVQGVSLENILRTESRTRNESLAEAFLKLGLVEKSGIGRKRIFVPTLSLGKRKPEYETDGRSVTLRIFDGAFDESMARMIARWQKDGRSISLDCLLVLDYLRDHAFIDSATAAALLQIPKTQDVVGILDRFALPKTGFLERRGHTAAATYHLAKGVVRDLHGKAAYTRNRGVDRTRYEELVRTFVEHHGSITPVECRELLGLGESQTAKNKVSQLLGKMSQPGGLLRREGKSPRTRYFPRESQGII